jgi:hypothetical protein
LWKIILLTIFMKEVAPRQSVERQSAKLDKASRGVHWQVRHM